MENQRKFWGWGNNNVGIDHHFLAQTKQLAKYALGIDHFETLNPPDIQSIQLRAPRFSLSPTLTLFCAHDAYTRASHSYGKSFRDVWRGLQGQFDNPPDYVAFPINENQIIELMAFAQQENIALIPYGGGSSVVGGVEPTLSDQYQGVITIDMQHFNQILEVDFESRCARIQAGIYGPALEAQLKYHGLTLRHFPQSFEFSTLGGWIATRAGGHYATLYTHIDEFVESIKMITPKGIMQTRRLPGSGAGPSEERLVLGSEGIFGIITEAWMRLQSIPTFKASTTINFAHFVDGVQATRALAQSGLYPSNARLVDKMEALTMNLGNGQSAILILGFESHQHPVDEWLKHGLAICAKHKGQWDNNKIKHNNEKQNGSAEKWKRSFLQAPYLRDELIQCGVIVETFETAVTWDQFEHFHQQIMTNVQAAINQYCGKGIVTCRFTHIYPDGPAPYYTVLAKGEPGKQLVQWDRIKQVACDTIIEHGGTITHHHAVGKDHQPYYQHQHSKPFETMLRASKQSLDPQWILNPDVLLNIK